MLVPIACRLIPYDQWFVTRLDDGWKVRQVKHWILSKCNLLQSAGPQIQRPVSPITFAPTLHAQAALDSLDDGYNEDDEYSEQDLPLRSNPPKPGIYHRVTPSSQPSEHGSSPLVDRYMLISFSTGSMLEDEFTLSWYRFRPFELLEMHPVGTIAPLRRDVLAEYIQPYFQARVRVLRVVWNHRSGRFDAPGTDIQCEPRSYLAKDKLAQSSDALSPRSSSFPSRKNKISWKARWVVISQGVFSLCKEHMTNPPLNQFALSSMTALRGSEALERAFSIAAQPRVVCIKFRPRLASASLTSVVSPTSSLPSSPISEELRDDVHKRVDSESGLATEQEEPGGRTCENAYEQDDPYERGGEWVILDMLDDHAYSSVLRILHREASQPISSSFAPSSSIVAVSPHSPVESTFGSYDTIRYPEWRTHTVENARNAGMGDLGKPMAWVLWTDKGPGETLAGNIRHHRRAFLEEMQHKTSMTRPDVYGFHDDSDEESEREWEGWMRDLERQSRVKRQAEKESGRSRPGQTPTSGLQLPSPPLSEASLSGSPRARASSFSMPRAVTGSIGPRAQGQYPNIGNVAGAGHRSGELPYSGGKMENETASVETVPWGRRRSSTVSAGVATSKGRPEFVCVSPTSPRTVSASAGRTCSPRMAVRHTHSNSNLRTGSSPCESDAGELPSSSSPSIRQSGFMRGVTLRASKIVRSTL